jgi:hypothetical protein
MLRRIALSLCLSAAVSAAQSAPAVSGAMAFATRCSVCHSGDGSGTERGPNILVPMAESSDERLASVILKGTERGMPAQPMPDAELQTLIAFLRTMEPPARRTRGPRPGTARLTGGGEIEGLILAESSFDLHLRTADGNVHRLLREGAGETFSEAPILPKKDWRSYHNDSANRYLDADQINRGNVAGLTLRWMFPVLNVPRLEATPVVVDGIYQFPGLQVGQKFHGSLNIKIESPAGYSVIAGFGQYTDSNCQFPDLNQNVPIPFFGYRRSNPNSLSVHTEDQSGALFARIEPVPEILGGVWHTVDFELEPISDGVNQYELRLNGTVIHAGLHYRDLTGARELGVEIGIAGSGAPNLVKYDNIKIEIVEPTPVSCIGFDPPMDKGPVTVKGKNRALPLKAQLFDETGTPLTDVDFTSAPVIQVLYDAGQGGDSVDVSDTVLPAGQGSEGNQFDFSDSKWHYNLKTKGYTAPGTYHLSIVSGEDAEYEIVPACQASFVVE